LSTNSPALQGLSVLQEFTFERTQDLDLVREILTAPPCWRRMTDDQAPSPEAFQPIACAGLEYVVAVRDGRALAIFVLIVQDAAAEVHFCFRPEAWGESAPIARAFVEWVWRDTPWTWLMGPVPEHNRLALRLAEKAGFTRFAVHRAAVRRRGKTYDRILMQIARPSHEKPAPRIVPARP
jgi:RimJ/RimL family protein N-acetyltransferase